MYSRSVINAYLVLILPIHYSFYHVKKFCISLSSTHYKQLIITNNNNNLPYIFLSQICIHCIDHNKINIKTMCRLNFQTHAP